MGEPRKHMCVSVAHFHVNIQSLTHEILRPPRDFKPFHFSSIGCMTQTATRTSTTQEPIPEVELCVQSVAVSSSKHGVRAMFFFASWWRIETVDWPKRNLPIYVIVSLTNKETAM